MTALRQLSVFYVAAAGAYAIAMAMSAHPNWTREAQQTATYVRDRVVAFDDHILRPDFRIAEHASHALGQRIAQAFSSTPTAQAPKLARALPAKHPKVIAQSEVPAPIAPAPYSAPSQNFNPPVTYPPQTAEVQPPTPAVPPSASPYAPSSSAPLRGSDTASAPSQSMTLVPPGAAPAPPTNSPGNSMASIPPGGPPNAGEIVRVEQRLKDSLTSELYANFELFLYVSKADAGPWAQRMYVFQKDENSNLNLLYNWPVSTGREQIETNPQGHKLETSTPQGYYELDPHRSYEKYHSAEWDQDMPYAMFFKWEKDHRETGLAIHAATDDDIDKLGHRASSGCIHLSEDNARTLFQMIRSQYKGLTPRFAYDRRTGTMSNEGILLHDASGNPQMGQGYKVLVFIEDYGGQNVVAALY
jgi:lipoprotein-anchoring transpeptidase ErfK/SrfK